MSEKEKVAEDCNITVREEDSASGPRRWTTTRVELWAFYVYYIVSMGLIAITTSQT